MLTINAGGGGTPATASNLLIDMDSLEGNATFDNIQIGRDASTLDAGPDGAIGAAGSFGQQADKVTILNLQAGRALDQRGHVHPQRVEAQGQRGRRRPECF